MRKLLFGILLIVPLLMHAANSPSAAPSAAGAAPKSNLQKATLGGGCFWCLEAVYERFEGVLAVASGYAAGSKPDPTYKEVCGGATGHAEVVQIDFDPARISYSQILEIFWEAHDPTTLNRQGADEGTQYRSIIICHDEKQKRIAEESKADAAKRSSEKIVTEIVSATQFYPAEDFHQDYFRRNPRAPYCAVVISPKLQKLQKFKFRQAAAKAEAKP